MNKWNLAVWNLAFATAMTLAGCVDTPDTPEALGRSTSALTLVGGTQLLWHNPTSGQVAEWVLNGTYVASTGATLSQLCGDVPPDTCSQDWTVVDTRLNTVLWWNKQTGHLSTWEFDSHGNVTIDPDLSQTCGINDGCITSSNDWRPIGRVVFTVAPNQFQTGLLWHDPISGEIVVWDIGQPSAGSINASAIGTSITGAYSLTQTCSAAQSCSTQWTAKATADFDGDGNSDLAWLSQSGAVSVWLLNASPAPKGSQTINLTCGGTCAQDWRLVGAADFNGDGLADLLWHNYQGDYPGVTPGTLRNWLLDGTGYVSQTLDLSQKCDQASGCAANWAALGYVNPPARELQSFQTGQATIRPVVAVGRDYVFLTDVGSVTAFKREASDGLGTISSNWVSDPNVTSGTPYSASLVDIFHEQIPIYNAQAQALNSAYQGQVANPVQPCNWTDSSYLDVKYPSPAPTNGCASVAYDGDTIYDEYSGHFFVMTKVQRPVWTCDTNGSAPGGTGWWDGVSSQCNDSPGDYAVKESARPLMVAVTKCNTSGTDCENPNNGWITYTLAQADQDWAQIMVARGLVIVNYHDTNTYEGFTALGTIWGFSANSLITEQGYPSPASRFLPTPGFQTVASDFQTSNGLTNTVMLVKLHNPTSADFPMVVTQDGSDVAAYNLVPTDPNYVQAAQADPLSPTLWDLSPWIGSIEVSGEASAALPAGMTQQWNAHPVWSANATGPGTGGALYWSFLNGSGVTAFRWPMTQAPLGPPRPPGSTLSTGTSQGFQRWDVSGPTGYDFPVVEHNEMSGDTVLLFDTWSGTTGFPFETSQFAVAGPTDTSFSTPVTIQQSAGSSNGLASVGGTVDIVSNVSDPIRPQVFMTSVASNFKGGFAQWMTSVQLDDTPITPPPATLQAPLGTLPSVFIPFPGPNPTNVSPPLPTCTAGGDIGSPTTPPVVTAQGVTVQFDVPWTAPVNSPLVEGVSCTNGVSAAIPVVAQLYPDCSASYVCDGKGSATNQITCGLLVNDLTLMRWGTTGCAPGQSQCLQQVTNVVVNDPYTWWDYYAPAPGTTIGYQVYAQLSGGSKDITPTFSDTVTSTNCSCWSQIVCQLPGGQVIYPSPNSPPNWCSSKGGKIVNKTTCPKG